MGGLPSLKPADTLSVCPDRQQPHLGIHAVTVFVRDQDQSLRFYLDQLGFDLAFDARLQSGDRWVAVAPPDGTAVLALVAPLPDSWEHKLIGRPTGVVFVSENVVAKYEEWRRRGVRFLFTPRLRRVKYERPGPPPLSTEPSTSPSIVPGQPPVWGGVFTRFKDVDGNSFSLIGFDEVSREIEAQRRRTAEKLESERRGAQELEFAKQVQARLFPQRLPPMETLEYAGACVQARQVGGDYHDILDLGQGRFGLVIADISGKGMAAALLMANLQANLRSQCASASDDPERWLRSVNKLFYESTHESAYATLFFAEYDDRGRRLRYANCGHLAPLLLRCDSTIEKLDSTGTVLGLFKEWDCRIAEHRLFPGDTLVLYTDGITESFDDAGEEFGEQRLIAALQRHRELPPQAVIASIVEEVQQFSPHEQHDDITLIVARCLR
ncbi:MAG TPA: SpoIIE family protein phosphatase [Candidatus Acidoferrales bacterium]|jgi:serine phosphatase RsbU (regulator of sigma subunit)|nr:SpoIIE family protein phosphatase [Candidatus Acidoferrales bacterium]